MRIRKMKKGRRRGLLLSILLTAVMAGSMTLQASAFDLSDLQSLIQQIDPSKRGSVELTLTKFSGGEVSIYPVIGEDGYIYDTKTNKATDNPEVIKIIAEFEKAGSDKAAMAKAMTSLTDFLAKSDIKALKTEVISNGAVKFPDLGSGLYLIKLTKASDNGYSFVPFLISLPDSDGKYEIVGAPKPGVVPPTTPDNPSNNTPNKTPTSTKTGDKLPQTGQLWWPVPMMAAAGLILLTAGVKRRKSVQI